MCTCVKYILLLAFTNVIVSLPTTELNDDSSLGRIVNGYAVNITEVPYQASLRRKLAGSWSHICGAVIISNNAVLTAAHCTVFNELNPSALGVVVGTSHRISGGQTYDVSKVIVHENYSSITLENDISIVVLARRILFSKSVNSVPIAPSNITLPVDTEAIVSGFGTISYEGTSSTVLLAAKVKIVNQQSCARAYARIASVTTGMLCASAQDPPRDACQGDSGGPLVANGYLVGIVSWGEGCADAMYPGVYTRVSEYNNWIQTKFINLMREIDFKVIAE
ncbi:trypsin-1-like [Galleria mellonella]|uniref:Trypsin-1-like n=1 Tax=Galleria mellonella TaxID=7137 RepID=A0A6J1WKJ5_GALME|nr:trypsin-1-like [Galleria mellonella]